jgi:hypothetical protein
MLRAKTLGIALVAVFAMSAVVASAAFGASEFKTKTFPVTFTGKGTDPEFESAGKNIVKCEKSESTGKVTGATAAEVAVTYSGNCELKAETPLKITEKCPTIKTTALATEPVEKLNKSTKTGLDIKAKSGAIAEFTCEGSDKVKVKVTGSVICESTPIGKKATKGEIICKQTATPGEQEFTEATNSKKEVFKDSLEAESTLSIFKLKEKDAQITTEAVSYSAEIEQTE